MKKQVCDICNQDMTTQPVHPLLAWVGITGHDLQITPIYRLPLPFKAKTKLEICDPCFKDLLSYVETKRGIDKIKTTEEVVK